MDYHTIKSIEDLQNDFEIMQVYHVLNKNNENVSLCNLCLNSSPILVELDNLKVLRIVDDAVYVSIDEKTLSFLNGFDEKIFDLIDKVVVFDEDCMTELKDKLGDTAIKYSKIVKKDENGYYIKMLKNDMTKINKSIDVGDILQIVFLVKNLTFLMKDFLCGISHISKIINVQKIYTPIDVDVDEICVEETTKQTIDVECEFKTEVQPEHNIIKLDDIKPKRKGRPPKKI